MPISPSKSTGLKGTPTAGTLLSTGDGDLSATLTAVTAGHAVIVVTAAFKTNDSAGDLVTAVSVGGSAATARVRRTETGTNNHRNEICIWSIDNVTSGDKTVTLTVDGPLAVNWHADSWAIATSSAFDQSATSWFNTDGGSTPSVPASGVTANLAQASELVIAAIVDRYQWGFNGGYSDPGAAPSGWTVLGGQVEDNADRVGFQSIYKEVSSTGGVSATWSLSQTGGAIALAIATFKISTVSRRVKVLADSSINSATGITAYAWSSGPDTVLAQKWTGLTAESSGGIVYLTNPPAAWTAGTEVNVILYQPANDKKSTGFVVGKVEEY